MGVVLSREEGQVVLDVAGAGPVTLPLRAILRIDAEVNASVRESGEVWSTDPNRTRYLYGPSAMMLKKGEMSFSQKELVFSTFAYGLTDHVSLQVGSVIPALFLGLPGLNAIGAVKVGTPVAECFSVAAGAQALLIPGLGNNANPRPVGVALVFATATLGNFDRHLSVSAGRPFLFGDTGSTNSVGDFIFTVSGNMRVSRHVALISENWLVPSLATGTFGAAGSVAARVMGEHISADIGGVWLVTQAGFVTDGVPIPWLDFTYNF